MEQRPGFGGEWRGFLLATLAASLAAGPSLGATIVNTGQATYTVGATPHVVGSNLVTLETLPSPTPASIAFNQYAPGVPSGIPLPADGAECESAPGTFTSLPQPLDLAGAALDPATAPVVPTGVYHVGEPIFVSLYDRDRNLDPAVRDQVDVVVTTSTGDAETLRLIETGPDTGLFAAAIQSAPIPPPVVAGDCRLSVDEGTTMTADYVDPVHPADRARDDALVDPLGVVFDSSTGLPVDGATVTLVDAASGLPAIVLGDDGISTFPSTLVSGAGTTDSGGTSYVFPPGGFRFPLVAPGSYVLSVVPPAGYFAPSTVPLGLLQSLLDPNGDPYSVGAGSFGDVFILTPGPALDIDLPVDPLATALVLQKSASVAEASAGDFIQYRLSLANLDPVNPASGVVVTDTLPVGLRYQGGSLRIDGVAAPDPLVAEDGRTLTIPVGNVAAGATVEIRYVVAVGAGAPAGPAENVASAAAGGGLSSNVARSVVRLREPFLRSAFTIIGRVTDGPCDAAPEQLRGVPGVRLLLDDGTWTVTDADGLYHFEGVRPGTHVVQVDLATVPPELEVAPCIQNSRFAGRAFSRFIEAQAGTLRRADFRLAARPPLAGPVGIRLAATRAPRASAPGGEGALPFDLRLDVDGGEAPVTNLRVVVLLDDAVAYVPGSSRLAGGALPDPDVAESSLTFRLGDPPPGWRHDLALAGRPSAGPAQEAEACTDGYVFKALAIVDTDRQAGVATPPVEVSLPCPPRRQVVRATIAAVDVAEDAPPQPVPVETIPRFASGRSVLSEQEEAAVAAVIDRLRAQIAGASHGRMRIERLEVVGHTDSVRIAPHRRHVFADNYVLSRARAETVAGLLQRAFALEPSQVRIEDRGPDVPVASNDTEEGRARNRRCELTLHLVADPAPRASTASPAEVEASWLPVSAASAGAESDRAEVVVQGGHNGVEPARAPASGPPAPAPPLDDVAAAGGDIDWLSGRAPGIGWLFPGEDHNPRAPAIRIAIQHAPGQTVVLRREGEPVSPTAFDGVSVDPSQTVAVSVWRGLPLEEGETTFEADVIDADGSAAARLTRSVHYANAPARAILVPEASDLVADGIRRPVVAVRLVDRHGRPVRHGVTGTFRVDPPFVAAEAVDARQERQLAGMDRFAPQYRVEGDAGLARIELAPTTATGTAVLRLALSPERPVGEQARDAELRVWIEPAARDWVLVGFGRGTIGYDTLRDNVEAAEAMGHEDGVYSDGQVSLYARGRVRGKWLLTLAYDSDKPGEALRRESLHSTIDPEAFYTLYGDGTEQGYDAASQEKLYLKLESRAFYALFGDYDSGLTRTELTRYNRSLSGVKSEFGGEVVAWTAFAAETPLRYARDEIQGDGTSGLYRLSRGGLVINGEKVRLETRDRFRSERIVDTRALLRHIDYDIDYDAGTLFFREPIPSRDPALNPIFIVAEYETLSAAEDDVSGGGRLETRLLEGRLTAGATLLREEIGPDATDLGGVDLTLGLGGGNTVRAEGAVSAGTSAGGDRDGSAWLAELQHESERLDGLLYARRQDGDFGVSQQNAVEGGTLKAGADGRYRLTEHVALQGTVYRLENLTSDATREAASGEVRFQTDKGSLRGGVIAARDEAAGGGEFLSRQLGLGGSWFVLDKRLELDAQADLSLGGNNDNVDFPTRYRLGAAYALTDEVRLLVAQELTDGETVDSSTTRVGVQALPWQGGRLSGTLNQSRMAEAGPRTFALFGLTQSLLVGERWGFDVSLDGNRTFDESGTPPLVVSPGHPFASGGHLGGGSLTEDFTAVSGGSTYRAPLWSWNGRVELRDGQAADRTGLVSHFLRQATAGIAFSASAELFEVDQVSGTEGIHARADAAWAWRPLASRWSILDRLTLQLDEVDDGTGLAGSGLFGATSLTVAGDAATRRLINNFSVNRVSREWSWEDGRGDLFQLQERTQWSLYHGAKYAFDVYDGVHYSGFTDLLGGEWRHDVTPRFDIGFQASALHAWEADNIEYSTGPMIGVSPLENVWISVGYNAVGFHDPDFEAARYAAYGPWTSLRFKFDQATLARKGTP